MLCVLLKCRDSGRYVAFPREAWEPGMKIQRPISREWEQQIMIEPNRQGEVWVFAEQEDGALHDVVVGTCAARPGSWPTGWACRASARSCPAAAWPPLAEKLIAHGADNVYVVDDERLSPLPDRLLRRVLQWR